MMEPPRRLPNPLSEWDGFAALLESRQPVLALDYDGTLTPIAARPDLALIPAATRETLRQLADQVPVFIISGRARHEVQDLVGLPNLYYAGCHGFDISGPGGTVFLHPAGLEIEPTLRQISDSLSQQLDSIAGVLVENKRFALALHYRLVAEPEVARVLQAVEDAIVAYPALQITGGKKVIEVRPAIEWNKGQALLWLLQQLGLNRPAHLPIYLGDDQTDEDAFRVLERRGIGVLVSETPRPTRARFCLRGPAEVEIFLQKLLQL